MRHTRWWTLLLAMGTSLSGCTGMRFVIDTVPAVDELTETTVINERNTGSNKIAMIDVTGLIADAPRRDVLTRGENPVSRFTEALTMAGSDPRVRAVILRINSPGGTVTASDVMYRELVGFRERTGKPVVVLMADIAASGGYYLACGGDVIIAHPTTITGSIGVIIQTVNFSDGLQRIGIHADAITSGPNKAAGSPLEPMSAEHRELLQGIVNEFYGGFVSIVTENRPTLSPADLEWITDGRIITGQRAAEVGIVDRVGDLRDAFAEAKTRAGVERAKLVKYHRPIEYVGSPYSTAGIDGADANRILQISVSAPALAETTSFYYLWDPTAW